MRMRQQGFTLLELMVVIAIIGILAAIALPSYQAYIYRAKAAEIVLKLDKIKTALVGLEAETNQMIGKGMTLETTANQVEWVIRRGSNPGPIKTGVVAGIGEAELDLKQLGVVIKVYSGYLNANQPGQYKISLEADTTPQARQLVLAAHHIMQPHTYKYAVGTGYANLYFSLH